MLKFEKLFRNYEEFKELFGIVEHGNGAKSRKNKILLAYHKSMRNNILWNCRVRSMDDLKDEILNKYQVFCEGQNVNINTIPIEFRSKLYKTDDLNGVCEDGDIFKIRYINLESNKVYKMKASTFFSKVLNECGYFHYLPTQCKIWIVEELNFDLISNRSNEDYELIVDNDFEEIYDSTHYAKDSESVDYGPFGSCMTNDCQYEYYQYAVEAKAARIYSKSDGLLYARCVVFTNVRDDETGEKGIRLAERQYAQNMDESLKRILVQKLAAGGYIDGYKKIGACCSQTNKFLSIHGDDWSDRKFSIRCELHYDDTISYQDSFYGYDDTNYRAYNYKDGCYSLQNCDSRYGGDDDRNYDDYHDYYTDNDLQRVYYGRREYYVDEENMDDFTYVESDGEYHHYDDVVCCDHCNEYVLNDDAILSDITDEYYCCSDCLHNAEESYCERHNIPYSTITFESYESEEEKEEAELKYKQEHWLYSSLLDKYFEYDWAMEREENEYIEKRNITFDYLGNEISNDVAKVYHKTYMPAPGTFLYKLHGECFTDNNGRVVDYTEYTDERKYRIIGNIILDINPETNDIYEDAKKMFNL